MEIRISTAFSLLMLAIFAGMTGLALTYPFETRLFPLLVGLPATVLCIIQVLAEMKTDSNLSNADQPVDDDAGRRVAISILWFLSIVAWVVVLGFYIGAPIAVFLYYLIALKTRIVTALAAAIGLWLMLYFVFFSMLERVLFEGIILDSLA